MKEMKRLLYKCSFLRRFDDVVQRAREHVVGLYRSPHSLSPSMLVMSLNHKMNVVDDVLSNLGNREEEEAFSSQIRCCSSSVAVVTVVWFWMEAMIMVMMAAFC